MAHIAARFSSVVQAPSRGNYEIDCLGSWVDNDPAPSLSGAGFNPSNTLPMLPRCTLNIGPRYYSMPSIRRYSIPSPHRSPLIPQNLRLAVGRLEATAMDIRCRLPFSSQPASARRKLLSRLSSPCRHSPLHLQALPLGYACQCSFQVLVRAFLVGAAPCPWTHCGCQDPIRSGLGAIAWKTELDFLCVCIGSCTSTCGAC